MLYRYPGGAFQALCLPGAEIVYETEKRTPVIVAMVYILS